MPEKDSPCRWLTSQAEILSGVVVTAILAVTLIAPAEATMGETYRILFVHVPMAWLGLLGFMVMAAAGVAYLLRRDLKWDHWAHAAAELGWLCCSLTLINAIIYTYFCTLIQSI